MQCGTDEFAEFLKATCAEAGKIPPCTSLRISDEGAAVDLRLDTKVAVYGEWIKGEGADICLYRNVETERVVGCHLPLMNRELRISSNGPVWLNGERIQ